MNLLEKYLPGSADALRDVGTRLDNLHGAMTNMKVVLDSDVLVGETYSTMDKYLGTLAGRRERGN